MLRDGRTTRVCADGAYEAQTGQLRPHGIEHGETHGAQLSQLVQLHDQHELVQMHKHEHTFIGLRSFGILFPVANALHEEANEAF